MKYMIFMFYLGLWILLTVIILVESERPQFRNDFRYEKGFRAFYKVHHTAAPWREARVRCQGEGAELMVPSDLDEADAMPLLISTILNHYEGVFVGAHDLYSERSFVTIDGLQMLDSILNLLWEHGHPAYGAGRCLAMHHNGRFFVHPCDKPLPFICKATLNKPVYYEECDTFDSRWKLGPNNTCYIMHTEPQRWFDAFATCLSAGGHLAIMNNRSEAEYVRSVFREVPQLRLPDNDFAFLGFNDLFQRYNYRTIRDMIRNTNDMIQNDLGCLIGLLLTMEPSTSDFIDLRLAIELNIKGMKLKDVIDFLKTRKYVKKEVHGYVPA